MKQLIRQYAGYEFEVRGCWSLRELSRFGRYGQFVRFLSRYGASWNYSVLRNVITAPSGTERRSRVAAQRTDDTQCSAKRLITHDSLILRIFGKL